MARLCGLDRDRLVSRPCGHKGRRSSAFRLGAMLLHCGNGQLLKFASSINLRGLTLAEQLSLSALAQRVMALRALAQGAWTLGAVSHRVGGWRRLPALENVRRFSSCRTLQYFIEASRGQTQLLLCRAHVHCVVFFHIISIEHCIVQAIPSDLFEQIHASSAVEIPIAAVRRRN